MEDLIKLKEALDNYKKYRGTLNVQLLFSAYNKANNDTENNWSCGGCIRRVMEKSVRILEKNNLL